MIDLEWPLVALALPLPWLVRYLVRPAPPRREAALRVPFLEDFAETGGRKTTFARPASRRAMWVAVIAWALLVLAGMRPQWLGELVPVQLSGRDLMLAVDLSGSMQEEDFLLYGKPVDRLTATKAVAADFINRRVGDRIGLILFGEQAYLQAPLTFDRETVSTFLMESVIGLAGRSTAIGDAIGLAVKRLRGRDSRNRVLILLTDGANTAGAVDPLEAANLAARERLRIHTIGVGADKMLIRDLFGLQRINPSAELDEAALKAIAERTGGRYFRARDTDELEEIYAELDKLEPIEGDTRQFRPKRSLYYWPLAMSLALAAVLAWTLIRRRAQ